MNKTLTLILLLTAARAAAMEPVERFHLNAERPVNDEQPCSDSWERLHFWYSDVNMSCALFREQILGCADRYRANWMWELERGQCMGMVALGSDYPKKTAYERFGRWRMKEYHLRPYDQKDIERVQQMLRVLHGIPPLVKDPMKTGRWIYRQQRRLAREGGNHRTQRNRDAVESAARRTRYDP